MRSSVFRILLRRRGLKLAPSPARSLPDGGRVEIEIIVEIPQGSRNKYEMDHASGRIRLDRMLFTSTRYPLDYGFIPDTLAEDGDPLDAMVLLAEPTFPGCSITARPVGVFWMHDEHGPDAKILAVPGTRPAVCGRPGSERCPRAPTQRDWPLLRHLQGAGAGQGHRRAGLAGPRRGGAGDHRRPCARPRFDAGPTGDPIRSGPVGLLPVSQLPPHPDWRVSLCAAALGSRSFLIEEMRGRRDRGAAVDGRRRSQAEGTRR